VKMMVDCRGKVAPGPGRPPAPPIEFPPDVRCLEFATNYVNERNQEDLALVFQQLKVLEGQPNDDAIMFFCRKGQV